MQNKEEKPSGYRGENDSLKHVKNCQDLKDMLEYYEANYPDVKIDLKGLNVFGGEAPRRNNIKNVKKPGRDTIYSWDEDWFLIRPFNRWRVISRDEYKNWADRPPVVIRRAG